MRNEMESEELISRLANLIKDYQEEMERKEIDIKQMKKLLSSYEAAIQDLERERNSLYGPGNSLSRSPDIRASRSDSKANLEANVYISTLLRKLSLCE
jgi:hypothetical protein